jgi:hypothetical protein
MEEIGYDEYTNYKHHNCINKENNLLYNSITTKEQLSDIIKFNNKMKSDYIIRKIHEIIDNPNKYKCGKYIKLAKIRCNNKQERDMIQSIIRKELFDTDLLFNVKIIYRFTPGIYIKFYHQYDYPNKIKLRFDKLLKKSIKKNSNLIFLKTNICPNNKFMAECYIRNFNLILGPAGYEFKFSNQYKFYPKYSIYTRINDN